MSILGAIQWDEAKANRYQALAHAMQSGVATDQERGSKDGTPKHLRVGINSALVETSALGGLLVSKGIITADEYQDAILEMMAAEVDRYEKLLSERYGIEIKLA